MDEYLAELDAGWGADNDRPLTPPSLTTLP